MNVNKDIDSSHKVTNTEGGVQEYMTFNLQENQASNKQTFFDQRQKYSTDIFNRLTCDKHSHFQDTACCLALSQQISCITGASKLPYLLVCNPDN